MFFAKKLYCRTFQAAFRLAMPLLPYRQPHKIRSCEGLSGIFKKEKTKAVLVVTDKGIAHNGIHTPVIRVLEKSGVKYAVYDKTQPNPTVNNVEEAFSLYKHTGADCLIAIGGGSAMDCAKAVGARAAYPRKSLGSMKGVMRILRRLPTLIAIPTTAGTGSEVTPVSIITDSERHHKYALMSFPLIPHYAVLDASLTLSLPPHLTATTGMDALTHAVEAYIGRSTTAETRKLAKGAVKLVFDNVYSAYSRPNDPAARENMLFAAYTAGLAFSKSYVGYIHAVAHSLGGRYGTPHGLANASLMPYVLEAYGKSVHKKLHELAICAGISDMHDSHKEGADKFIAAIRTLNEKMGIPQKLPEIKERDIAFMARHAEAEANPLYPVPVLMTAKELEKFYYMVWEGSRNDK